MLSKTAIRWCVTTSTWRWFSISKSPPPATPSRAFIPRRVRPDRFVDPPPKLFVDQPENVKSTGDPPVTLHRSWSKNRGRNRFLKKAGYLLSQTKEEFGPPRFVMPGDEEKAPLPVLDLDIWRNAVVLVDKPKRWTSHDVCAKLRDACFGYPFKVGHTGTLDPLATGLLIVCMGDATKCVEKLMNLDKEYSGTMKLGAITASFDAAEPISARRPWQHILDDQIEKAAKKFVGDIKQRPPMFSAVRQNGKRLHEYARKGVTIERKTRPVKVSEFQIKRLNPSSAIVHYHIKCSTGTYVRTLVHDVGQVLDCGAYVRSLRRDAIGPYRLSDAWNLEKLLKVIEASKIASQ